MLVNRVKLGIENRRINKAFYEWSGVALKKIRGKSLSVLKKETVACVSRVTAIVEAPGRPLHNCLSLMIDLASAGGLVIVVARLGSRATYFCCILDYKTKMWLTRLLFQSLKTQFCKVSCLDLITSS